MIFCFLIISFHCLTISDLIYSITKAFTTANWNLEHCTAFVYPRNVIDKFSHLSNLHFQFCCQIMKNCLDHVNQNHNFLLLWYEWPRSLKISGSFPFILLVNKVYIHIGTLFAELTKTVPSLHMHRYLSAINSNNNGKSWRFSNYADERSYDHKKEVYHGTLECFSYLFSCCVYS